MLGIYFGVAERKLFFFRLRHFLKTILAPASFPGLCCHFKMYNNSIDIRNIYLNGGILQTNLSIVKFIKQIISAPDPYK